MLSRLYNFLTKKFSRRPVNTSIIGPENFSCSNAPCCTSHCVIFYAYDHQSMNSWEFFRFIPIFKEVSFLYTLNSSFCTTSFMSGCFSFKPDCSQLCPSYLLRTRSVEKDHSWRCCCRGRIDRNSPSVYKSAESYSLSWTTALGMIEELTKHGLMLLRRYPALGSTKVCIPAVARAQSTFRCQTCQLRPFERLLDAGWWAHCIQPLVLCEMASRKVWGWLWQLQGSWTGLFGHFVSQIGEREEQISFGTKLQSFLLR